MISPIAKMIRNAPAKALFFSLTPARAGPQALLPRGHYQKIIDLDRKLAGQRRVSPNGPGTWPFFALPALRTAVESTLKFPTI
jgi:hypothetical protein